MRLDIKATNAEKTKIYPSTGDQLDAIWKILEAVDGPEDAEAVRTLIKETKKAIHRSDK